MVKTTDYSTLIQLQEALRRLSASGARFPMSTAVKLSMVASEVDTMVSEFMSALRRSVPKIADKGADLDDTEMEVYSAMMASKTELNTMGITMPDISMDEAARLDLPTVNILMSVF